MSLQVTNAGLTDRYLRHEGGRAITTPVDDASSDLLKADATFEVVNGLDGSDCYSLEASNFAGEYLVPGPDTSVNLRPFDGSDRFRRDATFCARNGLAGDGSGVSFESRSRPDNFLRHAGALVWLDPQADADLFRQDATWGIADPWATGSGGGGSTGGDTGGSTRVVRRW